MLDLSILNNLRAVLAILGGLVLMLTMVLTYQAVWRPRGVKGPHLAEQEIKGPVSFFRWWVIVVPWIITLTFVGIGVYGLAYVLAKIASPPNW